MVIKDWYKSLDEEIESINKQIKSIKESIENYEESSSMSQTHKKMVSDLEKEKLK